MITGINISHVWVFDQDEALDFYVGKLGLEVTADVEFGPMWVFRRKAAGDSEVIRPPVPSVIGH